MVHATEILGAKTYDPQGNFVGWVREAFVEPADSTNRIAWFLLERGRYRPLMAKYSQIAFVAPGTLKLNVDDLHLEAYRANEGWLAVGKDLLDQQIIDTSGRKVVRVNDLDLAEATMTGNGHVELRITQVDVGLPGAVRRLLQGIISPGGIRKIQRKLPTRTILWEFVNLIEPDPMRRVRLRITHQKLAELHPADLADIMEELSPVERTAIMSTLDDQTAAEALAELDERVQAQMVEKMDPEKAAEIIDEMDPDEAADLIADLSPETSKEVLNELPREGRQGVRELLQFDENSAGGMMNTEFVFVGEDATREEVISWIRDRAVSPDHFDTVFLIDHGAVLSGAVPVTRLLLADNDQKMSELRSEPLVSTHPDADERDVVELFDKYNLRSLAVISADGCPIGVITVDDVVSHLRKSL
ncbi:MAG: magnesium transporter [Acidobacteria bacterium]|nr:magnesium transporter [Acidobacteriota bacterium]